MKLIDTEETIVLVTGSSPTAEQRDRPLAYRLREEIDRRGGGQTYRRAVVVADRWYLEHQVLHHNPTVAIGGPGANGVSQEFSDLPTVYSAGERVFVQADLDGEPKRATLWGIDASHTAAAVEAFTSEGFLDELLGKVWKFKVREMA
jgi:hypothetical protein